MEFLYRRLENFVGDHRDTVPFRKSVIAERPDLLSVQMDIG
jgi:hypothetical protein